MAADSLTAQAPEGVKPLRFRNLNLIDINAAGSLLGAGGVYAGLFLESVRPNEEIPHPITTIGFPMRGSRSFFLS